jgi:hypothetical protein
VARGGLCGCPEDLFLEMDETRARSDPASGLGRGNTWAALSPASPPAQPELAVGLDVRLDSGQVGIPRGGPSGGLHAASGLINGANMSLKLFDLRHALDHNPASPLNFLPPDGDMVPAHFHITEVGRVRKDFIGCGRTIRSSVTCLLQVWVTLDFDHRLKAVKLSGILKAGDPLLGTDDPIVEVEHIGGCEMNGFAPDKAFRIPDMRAVHCLRPCL